MDTLCPPIEETGFLSTPSGWRATSFSFFLHFSYDVFLSTPSGWRATLVTSLHRAAAKISIHALRVEGDSFFLIIVYLTFVFLSPPSGWRATSAK